MQRAERHPAADVVEFPADRANFTGEMVREPVKLVEVRTIRVVDTILLTSSPVRR